MAFSWSLAKSYFALFDPPLTGLLVKDRFGSTAVSVWLLHMRAANTAAHYQPTSTKPRNWLLFNYCGPGCDCHQGITAVYLLFAYTRLDSILRKASDDRAIDVAALIPSAAQLIMLEHPAERALVRECVRGWVRSMLSCASACLPICLRMWHIHPHNHTPSQAFESLRFIFIFICMWTKMRSYEGTFRLSKVR